MIIAQAYPLWAAVTEAGNPTASLVIAWRVLEEIDTPPWPIVEAYGACRPWGIEGVGVGKLAPIRWGIYGDLDSARQAAENATVA